MKVYCDLVTATYGVAHSLVIVDLTPDELEELDHVEGDSEVLDFFGRFTK